MSEECEALLEERIEISRVIMRLKLSRADVRRNYGKIIGLKNKFRAVEAQLLELGVDIR